MPLRVAALAAYRSSLRTDPWTQGDYDAVKFIKAIKREPFEGFATVLVHDQHRHLDETTALQATGWFGEWAAAWLRRQLGPTDYVLVPVPSSRTTPNTMHLVRKTAPYRLAAATHRHSSARSYIQDILCWDEPMDSARKGGTRDCEQLFAHLRYFPKRYEKHALPHVLVDDVVTTGGHLRAAACFLRLTGRNVVAGLCAGRTTIERPNGVFDLPEEELPDFEPPQPSGPPR